MHASLARCASHSPPLLPPCENEPVIHSREAQDLPHLVLVNLARRDEPLVEHGLHVRELLAERELLCLRPSELGGAAAAGAAAGAVAVGAEAAGAEAAGGAAAGAVAAGGAAAAGAMAGEW